MPKPEGQVLSSVELAELSGGALRRTLTENALWFSLDGADYVVQLEDTQFVLDYHSEAPFGYKRPFNSLSALLLAVLADECRVIPRKEVTHAHP